MKILLVLVLGVALGVGGIWYYQQQHVKPALQGEVSVSSSPESVPDKAKKAWNDARSDLNVEGIKEDLARSGKVVRKKMEAAGHVLADATSDARATATIKSKFAVDSDLSAMTISVNTTDGLVTLSGSVKSPEDIARAVATALATEGVRQVESTLQVAPAKAPGK